MIHNDAPIDRLVDTSVLSDEVKSYTDKNDGLTRYYVGKYSSFEQAEKANNELQSKNFTNSIIVIIHRGEILLLEEYRMIHR